MQLEALRGACEEEPWKPHDKLREDLQKAEAEVMTIWFKNTRGET
jgi:hypothetical protein